MYDFLWKDDMYGAYSEFIAHDPGNAAIHKEVERLLQVERKVMAIPQVLPIGSICLQTGPIRDALHGFAMAWKNQYASVLHEEAKVCRYEHFLLHFIERILLSIHTGISLSVAVFCISTSLWFLLSTISWST